MHRRSIPALAVRPLHSSSRLCRKRNVLDARDPDHEEKSQQLIVHHGKQYFDEMAKRARDKETFILAVSKYLEHENVYRRGVVEFIYASVEKMKEFHVHRDLEAYKKIMDLFPKEKLLPKGSWQAEMMHYPKQQQCAIDLLEHMEDNGL
jgi:signaling intermediate in Toll pathway protein